MGFLNIKITTKKNGVEVPWFRTDKGRVRTSMSMVDGRVAGTNEGVADLSSDKWVSAQKMRDLGEYGIELVLDRVSKGIGSNDAPMPPLKQSRKLRWSTSGKKLVEYGSWNTGYPAFKQRLGLKPIRDLYGPGGRVLSVDSGGKKRYRRSGTTASRSAAGGRGHMLDDLRITFVDANKVVSDITNSASRVKARANEERAPWRKWSPSDVRKLSDRCAEVLQMAIADRMATLGFAARGLLQGSSGWVRAVRRASRRAA